MRPNQMVLTSIDCPTCGRKWGFAQRAPGYSLAVLVMRCRRRALQNHH